MLYAMLSKVVEGIAHCCGWSKEGKKKRIPKWKDLERESDEDLIEHLRSMRRKAQGRCPSSCC